MLKLFFIVTLFYPLESSSELSWILILPEYGFILAHMTNHSIALHGLRILLSCIYLSPIMIATYLEVMIWTSIYTIWVCFHIIDINPKMLSFFFGGFCRICIIIHWDLFCSVMGNKLIMGLDPSCKYGTGSWKKKKDGDLRLSKRLGFSYNIILWIKGHFSYVCVFYYTKYSYLIWWPVLVPNTLFLY